MFGKIILWLSAIIFIVYGLACLFSPELPAGYAGLGILTGDGYAEIGAMYGGLQTGFGIVCLIGAQRDNFRTPILLVVAIVIGSLALGRLYSMLNVTDAVGIYTQGALAFESVTALLAFIAYRGSADK